MKVAIGSDHAGFQLKRHLIHELEECNYKMLDCGPESPDSVDYPDFAKKVCDLVLSKQADLGILICGTGIGISIAANKIKGIRAALCNTEFSTRLARQHNDANVLALGGNVLGNDIALSIAKIFLTEPFSHGKRHMRRINKMMSLEDSED